MAFIIGSVVKCYLSLNIFGMGFHLLSSGSQGRASGRRVSSFGWAFRSAWAQSFFVLALALNIGNSPMRFAGAPSRLLHHS